MTSVDFIIELPKSIEFDIVMTVIDLVSKTAHFIYSNLYYSKYRKNSQTFSISCMEAL